MGSRPPSQNSEARRASLLTRRIGDAEFTDDNTRVNLLPHREARLERQKSLLVHAGLSSSPDYYRRRRMTVLRDTSRIRSRKCTRRTP